VKLDGSNDYVELGTDTSYWTFLHRGGAKWTMSTWIKGGLPIGSTGGGEAELFNNQKDDGPGIDVQLSSVGSNAIRPTLQIWYGNGQLVFNQNFGYVLRPDSWQHMTITYDQTLPSANAKLYLNGTLVASRDKTNDNSVNTAAARTMKLGSRSDASGYFLNATLDEVIFVNSTLSADEVYNLYTGGVNRTASGRWHRIVAADGLPSTTFNITDKNNTFDGQDYDMRTLFFGSGSSSLQQSPAAPAAGCYRLTNITSPYACSQDDSEFQLTKSGGIIYAGSGDKFTSICNDLVASQQTDSPYKFNLTATGPLRAVLPFASTSCSGIGNNTAQVFSKGLPSSSFGSYPTRGPAGLLMSLGYDRIRMDGDLRLSQGTNKVCVKKVGQEGPRILVNVTNC
jgi:hypothetical protein